MIRNPLVIRDHPDEDIRYAVLGLNGVIQIHTQDLHNKVHRAYVVEEKFKLLQKCHYTSVFFPDIPCGDLSSPKPRCIPDVFLKK